MRLNEVDGVRLTVLVDNYTDLLRADNSAVVTRPDIPNGEVLLAEHGLSLHITFWSGEESSSVLMDAGGSYLALLHNAPRVGVDLSDISAMIISHGHDDHMGSVAEVLAMKEAPLPLYIHPAAFSRRQKRPTNLPPIAISPPDRHLLTRTGALIRMTPGPTALSSDQVLVTGEIERTTSFERSNPIYYIEESGVFVPDLFRDDQAVVFSVKGKGLVVITGCAHAGVINTIQYARKITGVDTIYAVIGGFHLSGPYFRPIISPTVAAMKEIGPAFLIPLHCTGWEAMTRFQAEMPDSTIISTVGSVYQFGE